jgi:hypothetical protein
VLSHRLKNRRQALRLAIALQQYDFALVLYLQLHRIMYVQDRRSTGKVKFSRSIGRDVKSK